MQILLSQELLKNLETEIFSSLASEARAQYDAPTRCSNSEYKNILPTIYKGSNFHAIPNIKIFSKQYTHVYIQRIQFSCNNKYQTLKISNLFQAKTRTYADEKSILLHFYIVYICVVTGCSLMGRLSSFSGVMVSYKSAAIARKG